MRVWKTSPTLRLLNSSFVDLPAPVNLSANWNFGSILGLILVIQLVSGIILSTRFTCDISLAFDRVINLIQDSRYGWFLRLIHATGASFFFLFLYLHMGRGIYYGSFKKAALWNSGVSIYLLLMGVAFLGYVLPWGQMSYWAATVITNLLSAIPVYGENLVEWVWGGFRVGNPTLTRFYSLHFMLPFVVTGIVIIHIFYLHYYERSNPLGLNDSRLKTSFHLVYIVKDAYYFLVFAFIFLLSSLIFGYSFIDAENFIPANSLVTPIHIQPEWYFLFAYAILRSIPQKLGGVLGLVASVIALFILPIGNRHNCIPRNSWRILNRIRFWTLISTFIILTWLGSCPAEAPYILIAQGSRIMFFLMIGCVWVLGLKNNF